MDFGALAKLLLGVAVQAPALIDEAKTVFNSSRDNFSETDQAAIDKALADAQAADQAATDRASAALDEASKTS